MRAESNTHERANERRVEYALRAHPRVKDPSDGRIAILLGVLCLSLVSADIKFQSTVEEDAKNFCGGSLKGGATHAVVTITCESASANKDNENKTKDGCLAQAGGKIPIKISFTPEFDSKKVRQRAVAPVFGGLSRLPGLKEVICDESVGKLCSTKGKRQTLKTDLKIPPLIPTTVDTTARYELYNERDEMLVCFAIPIKIPPGFGR
ncbi:unnamed protein product [Darwinula stevensoni]|uniref:MD-2-related lipid-recognition domain-containing protein n=1 Tax=Darwinula stevensoni TaxID=69355 RepID=A0A7R9ACL1_9CRUS|nr:unnamed protein product [Darwinula stevensoni]CAG0899955.1 unnamed protein product [Darwinula stevensoni]